MGIEKPKFNKPEKKEVKERKMSKVESGKMLEEMDEYTIGLRALLKEKEILLKNLEKSKVPNSKKAHELKAELQEPQEQISGLTEFSEEGKEGGAEFTIKE